MRLGPLEAPAPTSLTDSGWTSLLHEENPLRRFSISTSRSCAAWLQFPINLVRDSEKSALNQFRHAAEADAPARRNPDGDRISFGSIPAPWPCFVINRFNEGLRLLVNAVWIPSDSHEPSNKWRFAAAPHFK